MSAIKTIFLDITEKTPLGYIYAKQGDINTRTLKIQLLNDGAVYDIPADATARFRLRKPDRTQVLNDAVISDNFIMAELTEQCLCVEGVAVAEVGLYGADGSLLTSETFMIKIVSGAVNESEIMSSNEFKTLSEALIKVESAYELAEMANEAADEALEKISQTEAAEIQRANAEAERVAAESQRTTAESARATAENNRDISARAYASAEFERVITEGARSRAEAERATAESARAAAENNRNTAESARTSAESERISAEAERVSAETERNSAENARATAENNRDTAETARASAETERVNAESERASAESQRATAENARAAEFEAMRDYTVKRYGARRVIGASSTTLERIWDAVGLTANVGVDSSTVVNDFDNIYPWSHIRTCNIEVVDGKVRVKAYEGEPTFSRDGSNGNVAVEYPEFYSCPPYMNDDGYEYFGVSEYPIGGWKKHEKAYYAAYDAGEVDGKLVSISGVFPKVATSRTSFRTKARATDDLCGLIDLQYHDTLSTLFTVEFATTNSQSKMSGATSLSYANTENVRAQITEENVNRIILLDTTANALCLGQVIAIGSAAYGSNIANNRIVTDIEIYDDTTKAVYFDGEAVTVTAGDYISSRGWISGATDNVAASSGSIVSNTDAKHPCKYRGIENPWGNIYQWVDGVNIKDWQAYICEDRTKYADGVYNGDYVELNYENEKTSGYIKERGYDERYPWARFPTSIGGGSNTYYSDYYYQNSGERALCFGGSFGNGALAGLWSFNANTAASNTNVNVGARLSWVTV